MDLSSLDLNGLHVDGLEEMKSILRAVRMMQDGQGKPPVMAVPLPPRAAAIETYGTFYWQMSRRLSEEMSIKVTNTMRAPLTHGPAPPLQGLQPITLREVAQRVNFIHTGRVLFLRIIRYPPLRVSGLSLLVEDPAGDVVHLSLYQYLTAEDGSVAQELLPDGTRMALLEPYMKTAQNLPTGALMLRCDNPQCVVVFRSQQDWDAARRGAPCCTDRGDVRGQTPTALREKGNALFRRGQYRAAAYVYSDALEALAATPLNDPAATDERSKVLGNRAECHLRLRQYPRAEADAAAAPELPKNRLRQAHALLAQERPGEALPLLDALLQDLPNDTAVRDLRSAAQCALEEQQSGTYDFAAMRKEAETRGGRLAPHHAGFVSPDIEIGATVMGKGRGVVARSPLRENQLVLASRALGFAPREEGRAAVSFEIDPNSKHLNDTAQSIVVADVIQTLLADASLGPSFYRLSAGDKYAGAPTPTVDAVIDVVRIYETVSLNSFAASGYEYQVKTQTDGSKDGESHQQRDNGSGLWVRESYFNHSCTPNCVWMQIADFQFTFVTRPVRAGEELCIPYCPMDKSFAERAQLFGKERKHSFICECELCAFLRAHPDVALLEEKCSQAFRRAAELVTKENMRMADAAKVAMPDKLRARLLQTLETVPEAFQSILAPALLFEGTLKLKAGQFGDALRHFRRVSAVHYAAWGGSLHFDRFQDECRVVGAMIGCGLFDEALAVLQSTYQTCCRPFSFPDFDFPAMVERFCTPWWQASPIQQDWPRCCKLLARQEAMVRQAMQEEGAARQAALPGASLA